MTGPCPICDAPRHRWPLIFRGDLACSIECGKALAARDNTKDDQ